MVLGMMRTATLQKSNVIQLKSLGYNKNLLIDIRKAFDSIDKIKLRAKIDSMLGCYCLFIISPAEAAEIHIKNENKANTLFT